MTLPVSKEAVSVFKEEMRTLADRIKTEESEEYNKNLIMQFLNRTYYAKLSALNFDGSLSVTTTLSEVKPGSQVG